MSTPKRAVFLFLFWFQTIGKCAPPKHTKINGFRSQNRFVILEQSRFVCRFGAILGSKVTYPWWFKNLIVCPKQSPNSQTLCNIEIIENTPSNGEFREWFVTLNLLGCGHFTENHRILIIQRFPENDDDFVSYFPTKQWWTSKHCFWYYPAISLTNYASRSY